MEESTIRLNQLASAFLYSVIIFCIITIAIHIPWIIYFQVKIYQKKKIVSRIVRNGIKQEDLNLAFNHRNQLLLYRYLLMDVTFELLSMTSAIVSTFIRSGLITKITQYKMDNIDWQLFMYLYAKYVTGVVEMAFVLCTLEMLNLTTLFVKDVYLRNNTHSGMRKKINGFIVRFLIVLGLGVSGVGLGIAYIVCEVFIIAQLVLYYRYSRQLYRSLGMYYQDVKYEFGETSIEARVAGKHKKHYKLSAVWIFITAFCLVGCATMFVITIPVKFLNEKFIEQTIIHSEIYYFVDIATVSLSSAFYLTFWLLYLPIYTAFSLRYLCDKFLFVRVYRHRFHVNGKYEIESLVQPLIK